MEMEKKANKILFICDADRSGAPLFMFHFLNWLKTNTSISFLILFRKTGVLENDFKKLAPVYYWQYDTKQRKTFKAKVDFYSKKILNLHNYKFNRFVKKLKNENITLVYSNTVHNDSIIEKLMPALQVPLLIHCHELNYVMQVANTSGAMDRQFKMATHFIAVSKAAKQCLINDYNISSEKISLIYNGLMPSLNRKEVSHNNLRHDLGFAENDFVILGMGSPHWLKGTDLFGQIAINVINRTENVHFIWVGGNETSREYKEFIFDCTKANISNRLKTIQNTPNPDQFFAIANLFLLTSRQESFSLVTLEAIKHNIPVLCFDGVGGPEEILNYDKDYMAGYCNTSEMADKIIELSKNPEKKKELAKRASERLNKEFDFEMMVSGILNVIESMNNKKDS